MTAAAPPRRSITAELRAIRYQEQNAVIERCLTVVRQRLGYRSPADGPLAALLDDTRDGERQAIIAALEELKR